VPRLQVVIGSTRPERVGQRIASWFEERAVAHGAFEVELVDLKELDLPMMNEQNLPRLRRYEHEHTRAWSATVERADAFAFVTPEYNHGLTAPVKNAIDYLHHEWQYKPVGFVSYGGVSAGTRAVAMLKQVVTAVKMFPVSQTVAIPFVSQFIEDDHKFASNHTFDAAAAEMLDELARVETALAPLRRTASNSLFNGSTSATSKASTKN